MKTIEQVVNEYKSQTLDGRDITRLAEFIPVEHFEKFGLQLKDPSVVHVPVEMTREAILKHLERDVEFAFEKAIDQRGISSSLMFKVIKMWNWILEEGLEDWDDDDYGPYGLPLYEATALKYGFNNPNDDD